ncbi:hypothetical protein MMC10_002368 [Thelotrema lepadinum]|nr:hypothetical protein [Thelotrema lepadinum]
MESDDHYPEDDPFSISIELREQGDSEANFRTTNDPKDPDQRSNVIQRKGIFHVNCLLMDVVHGYYSADGDDLCSVIIFKFRFETLSNSHRIKKVEAQVTFAAMNKEDPQPVVEDMYPEGSFSVQPQTQHETLHTSGGGKIGANAAGIEVGADLKRDKTVEKDATDAIKVSGSTFIEGRDYGKPNSAWWTLRENKQSKSGVPTSMQAAILLKRQKDMSKFQANFTIKISPNWLAAATSFMKSDPRDDPVIFDPRRPSTNRLRAYDTNDLGNTTKLNLKDLSDISVTTIFGETDYVEEANYIAPLDHGREIVTEGRHTPHNQHQ